MGAALVEFIPAAPDELLWCCCVGPCATPATRRIQVGGEWHGYACCDNEQHAAEAIEVALATADL